MADSDTPDEDIIVEPKDIRVLLLVSTTSGALRCLEHVGGNLLAGVVADHGVTKTEVTREQGTLIDPIGTDVYKVTKDYLLSIQGMLDINVEILEGIEDTNHCLLTLLS